MNRGKYNDLLSWKKNPNRKPLVLNGARQVGKSWLLNELGEKEYSKMVYFYLDRNEDARRVFENGGSAKQLLLSLSALADIDITPNDTLVVLDEIQECPQALSALKYFCEETPDIHIATAGSLLGITMHSGSSFPVGKVDVIQVYPMNFNEFLQAVGQTKMASLLDDCDWDAIKALDARFVELLRLYYYVGGMPAVVKSFADENKLIEVRRLQEQILSDYESDFSKHAPLSEVPKIRMVWQNIPSQLAKENKKFIYGQMKSGARAATFETAIQWLQDSGLAYKIPRTRSIQMPLKFYEDANAFKLFINDIGLLGAMMGVPAAPVLTKNTIFTEYKGCFTEVFVCMQLQGIDVPVFYYTEEGSRIEIDFAVQIGNDVFPVEVKAEDNLQSKSMKTFIGKNPHLKGIRLSMKPFVDQDWLKCVPLYAFREYFIKQNKEKYSV